MEEDTSMQGEGFCRSPNFPAVSIFERVRRHADYPRYPRRKSRFVEHEPLLEEVMSDPIIQQLITADNLRETDVRRTIVRAQNGLRLR